MSQDVSKLEGQILGGTYRIERKLGEGGMGAVYEASHSRLPRRFAIKMLSLAMTEYEDVVTRFKREAMVTSELGHPHIVEVVDFNHTDTGLPYIVMELLKGEDLETLLKRERRLPLSRAVVIFGQVASALQAAHKHNIIHRDLKPPNIFMCEREDAADFAKVVDFGISKVLGSDSVVTQTQATMGTPAYMSPEQAEGHSADVDARTDVFAMGTILYAMLAGRPPFVGGSVPAMLYKIVHQDPPPLRGIVPEIPEAVEAVINTSMNKKPDDRYASMLAFSQALEQALIGSGVISKVMAAPQRSVGVGAGLLPTMASAAAAEIPHLPTMPSAAVADQQERGRVTTLSSSAGEIQEETPPTRRYPLVVGVGVAMVLLVGITIILLRSSALGPQDKLVAARPSSKVVLPTMPTMPTVPAPPESPTPLRTITVVAKSSKISCRLQLNDGKTSTAMVPCTFTVPDLSQVKLEMRYGKYKPLVESWTVDKDRQIEVEVSRRQRRMLVASAAEKEEERSKAERAKAERSKAERSKAERSKAERSKAERAKDTARPAKRPSEKANIRKPPTHRSKKDDWDVF